MQITAQLQGYSGAPAATTAPDAATTDAPVDAVESTPVSAVVTLSSQGRELAAATGQEATLSLPDLDGIAKLDEALAGVPDTSASQARTQAQLAREKDKLKSKFSMLDVDAFRFVRDKLRAQLQQRPAPPAEQQKADEAAQKQRMEDSKPLM